MIIYVGFFIFILSHYEYILPSGFNFSVFGRSSPRPPVEFTGKAVQQSVSDSSKHYPLEMQKPSKPGHSRHASQSFVTEPSPNARQEFSTRFIDTSNGFLKSTNRNVLPVIQTYAENIRHEFSDATSSDWSIFTSSDEAASFTTESTRDSFSTVDYGDSSNMDPISSLFNYTPENNYMKISHTRPLTRFFPKKGHIEKVQRSRCEL